MQHGTLQLDPQPVPWSGRRQSSSSSSRVTSVGREQEVEEAQQAANVKDLQWLSVHMLDGCGARASGQLANLMSQWVK